MKLNHRFKVLGALLLLVSLAFPIARSCSPVRYEDAAGKTIVPDKNGSVPPDARVIENYNYVFEITSTEDRWKLWSVFIWPILVLVILAWKRKGIIALAIRVLEPLFIVGSGYSIDVISTLFTSGRASGAYIAFAALGLYTVGTVWEDINAFRDWRKARL